MKKQLHKCMQLDPKTAGIKQEERHKSKVLFEKL